MEKQATLIGLFRSGTNYTRTILELNYEITVNYDTWGWKHGLMPTYGRSSKFGYENDLIIQVVKNPYSTLLSWYKYIKKNNRNIKANTNSFADFIRSPVKYSDEISGGISPSYYFSNPVQMWNSVTYNHHSFVEQMNGITISYEDLLNNVHEVLLDFEKTFNLHRKNESIEVFNNITKNMNDLMSRKTEEDYVQNKKFGKKDYFLTKKFLDEYSDDDLQFVSENLDKNITSLVGYQLESRNNKADVVSNKGYVIYTVCNDDRLVNLCTLLESNSFHDNCKVKVIPFDDNIQSMIQLSKIYPFEIVSTDDKWDKLGKSIFQNEEYRKGLPSWRYFRKFNVFNEENENFIFLDSNVIICNSLYPVAKLQDADTFFFASRSHVNRNFKPWFKLVINRMNPYIQDGFNAGFWAANSNAFGGVNFQRLANLPGFRLGVTVSPEQSFLSILIGLYNRPVRLIKEDLDVHPMLSGDNKLDKLTGGSDRIFYSQGKQVLTIKWNGSYFSNKNKLPNAGFLKDYLRYVLEKVKKNGELYKNISNQMKLLGIEEL